jgi:DNA mismatch endonuclease (patch repair protein)
MHKGRPLPKQKGKPGKRPRDRDVGRNRFGLAVDAATSDRLGKIRQLNTTPELVVRTVAAQLGLRFRVHNPDLAGSPDLANRKRRWAIFVNGCFWHHHARCHRATTPKRNREFWVAKFANNQRRDRRAITALRREGFVVLTVWECDTLDIERVRARLARLPGPRVGAPERPSGFRPS